MRRERIVVGQQKARNAGNIILPTFAPWPFFSTHPKATSFSGRMSGNRKP